MVSGYCEDRASQEELTLTCILWGHELPEDMD